MEILQHWNYLIITKSNKSCKNEQIKDYIAKYPGEIIDMYNNLRKTVFDSVSCELEEKLWAKLPSYYVGDSFVRIIPFKNHINIEAKAVIQHKEDFECLYGRRKRCELNC